MAPTPAACVPIRAAITPTAITAYSGVGQVRAAAAEVDRDPERERRHEQRHERQQAGADHERAEVKRGQRGGQADGGERGAVAEIGDAAGVPVSPITRMGASTSAAASSM